MSAPVTSFLTALALASLWLPSLYLLSGQWAGYAEYRYGWAVPVLCAFLTARLVRKPLPTAFLQPGENCNRTEQQETTVQRTHHRSLVLASIVACAGLLFISYVVQLANPIWRAASWGLALSLVALSLLMLDLVYGRISTRRFSGPILFFLVAVPWPTPIEHGIVDLLTRLNTGLTTESLVWMGIPAMQRGNVIELARGVVGIDEACSGIRSTQANLMLALFFGEYHRFKVSRRLALVTFGFLFALLFNYARTALLTVIASKQGVEAMNRWHDPAGTTVLLGCFGALWLTSVVLRRRKGKDVVKAGGSVENGTASRDASLRDTASPHRHEIAECGERNADSSTKAVISEVSEPQSLNPGARWLLIGLTVWGLMIPVISEVWFQVHESKTGSDPVWSVAWPPSATPGVEPAPISQGTREQLLFDEGGSVRWRDKEGARWQMFYFRWLPALSIFRRVEVQFAKSHRPEICLPATGRMLKDQKNVSIMVNGAAVPFRFYDFDDRGRPLHVYLNVRDESMPIDSLANMRANIMDRLSAVWYGNRAAGQQTLQFAVWGIESAAESRNRLEQDVLPKIVKKG